MRAVPIGIALNLVLNFSSQFAPSGSGAREPRMDRLRHHPYLCITHLVFKAQRLLYHSPLGLSVTQREDQGVWPFFRRDFDRQDVPVLLLPLSIILKPRVEWYKSL